MELSYDIISQFAKVVNDNKKNNKSSETTVYGVVVSDGNGNKYVKLDGSDQLTPLSDDERPSADSTTANANVGDRVSVSIKNHTATVTGNVSSPSVRTDDFNDLSSGVDQISKFTTVLADRVQANEGYIKKLQSDKAEIGDLTAATAKITELETKKANVKDLTAAKAEIDDLKTKKLDAEVADIKYATVKNLNATNAKVGDISGQQAKFEETTTNKLTAVEGSIKKLDADKLSAKEADIKYAQIDFANIGKAAIEHFYATSGIIKDLVIGDTSVSGRLVGVTIIGDLIEGGTVKADKLVIQGTDGLYYKLNTDGMKTTAEQTDYNSLNGSIITAKSITAEKVNIHDLVAFGATIAGFNINETAIYSGVKDHPDTAVRGIYLDKDGQASFGDADSYLKYYKDSNGMWRLEIAADNVRFSSSKKTLSEEIDDIKTDIGKTIVSVDVEYYLSTSATSTVGGSWSTLAPSWVNGKYMWSRTVTTYNTGNVEYSPNQNGVCIAGATGSTGNAGKGVVSIVEEYYKSTSSSSLAGGSWSGVYPGWENDTYVWTRSIITYTDNTTTTTEAICVTGSKGEKGATGAAGKSIGSVVNYYLATASSSGVTTSTSGWTTTVQSVSTSKKYLWNYEVIKYTDGSVASTTTPCIIGAYGDKGNTGATGATGKGIKSVTEHYAVSASNTAAPTSWSTTVPTMTATNRYLWNYETITYTDNSTLDTTKRVIGVYGDKGNTGATGPQGPQGAKGDTGATGKGVKSTEIAYQASTSGTTIPTGTWSTSIPTVSAGSFLWTRTIITYTDNSKSTSYSIGKIGNTGAAGKGVKSTAITYQAGSSGTSAPTGTWSTSIPTTSASKPFLWTKTVITYTDNGTSTIYSVGSTPDSIQVGGRNLIRNSNFNNDFNNWGTDGVSAGISNSKTYGHYLRVIPNGSANKRFYQNVTNLWVTGQTYAYSFEACIVSTIIQLTKMKLSTPTGVQKTTVSSDTSISLQCSKPPGYAFISIDITDIVVPGVNYKLTYTSSSTNKNGLVSIDEATDSAFTNRTIVNATTFTAANGKYYRLKIYANNTGTASSENYTNSYSNLCLLPSDISKTSITPSRSLLDNGTSHVLSTTWKRYTGIITSTATVPDETISFSTSPNGVPIAVANIKLEKGNKATDWTPAPEDIDNRFDAAETRITQAETSIETTNNQIALKASTETVTEIGNRANQLDKALSDALTTIKQNSDAIATLTARDFKVEFTTLTNQLTQLNGDLTSYKKEVGNWMRFDAGGNLVLGATREEGQDAYELKLTKSRISFMLNDVEVAYISNNELYITNSTVVQNLKIGRFVWEVRGNGNLGLVWR